MEDFLNRCRQSGHEAYSALQSLLERLEDPATRTDARIFLSDLHKRFTSKEESDRPKKFEWERNKICLPCRQRGHSLKNCPNKNEEESADVKLCYNCGEMGHSLTRCPQTLQDGGTAYANCFICNQTGHLNKDCPKNTHGIYPKVLWQTGRGQTQSSLRSQGGCCKICGGVTQLARDCPNKSSSSPNKLKVVGGDDDIPQRDDIGRSRS